MYHDVLGTLHRNPLLGVCSPSKLSGVGVCPLTIISTIPDICRHMSNVIARAEREVYLATNFWMQSEPSRLITNALRELSRKAVATDRTVVVKIIYDRGNAKQVSTHSVLTVLASVWPGIGLSCACFEWIISGGRHELCISGPNVNHMA